MNDQQPVMNPAQVSGGMPPKKSGSIGPIVGIAIIIIVLLLGGLYFWGEQLKKEDELEKARQEAAQIENAPDSKTDRLSAQGSSDAASAIEADLSATDLNNLDEGTTQAEAELQ